MATTHSIGAHWLAPTWTLGVEEHFYLLIPVTIVFLPSRWLVPALISVGMASLGLRLAIFLGDGNAYIAYALLPGKADALACGLLAASAFQADGIPWSRIIPVLRIAPIIILLACGLLHPASLPLFDAVMPLLIAIACSAYLLCIINGTPGARVYDSKTLQFFGNNGYCLYLSHLPVLGIMHGLILGTEPDLATSARWLVTIAALPVCVLVGWGMTKLIEEPLTAYGRTWRWSTSTRHPSTRHMRNQMRHMRN
jgi:peptidoglycan/LPS O-acetylase OafA/YrhL